MISQHYNIKENSRVAKIAARIMKAEYLAIVFGSTIHLNKNIKQEFLSNQKWLKHELCHIEQYKKHGYFLFIIKYLLECFLRGYYNNKFEVEAREAECS